MKTMPTPSKTIPMVVLFSPIESYINTMAPITTISNPTVNIKTFLNLVHLSARRIIIQLTKIENRVRAPLYLVMSNWLMGCGVGGV